MLSWKSPWNSVAAVICFLSCAATLPAQDKGTATVDLSEVLRELNSIKAELKEVKNLLQIQRASLPIGASRISSLPQPLSQNITLPFVPEWGIGDKNAEFVLIQFSDPQCPFCVHFNKNTLPDLKEKYVSTGKIRFFNVEFPLESHPQAAKLSLASMCAGKQQRYWEMHDLLIEAQSPSVEESIAQSTKALALDQKMFEECVSSLSEQKSMVDHAEMAKKAGIYSTPTFLFGQVEDGKVVGITLVGDIPAAAFNTKVDEAIMNLRKEHNETKVASNSQSK